MRAVAARAAHLERHTVSRIGWLRAAVLGANDGIVSTASLIVGVAAAAGSQQSILIAGLAGLIAGAMSMAAGEFVSVSSQADAEKAELTREAEELRTDPETEEDELTHIYESRGLSTELAREVAKALMAKDALVAHARDELGLIDLTQARPLQAAGSSAVSFAIGAVLPLMAAFAFAGNVIAAVVAVSLVSLALLGFLGARAGSAPPANAVLRVVFWGAVAMGVTAGAGLLFNAGG
ncbi:MAG: VIT family protein [Proteobacteria bacterium]|nr:VIT family protein [Pseudomonadota bacterium]